MENSNNNFKNDLWWNLQQAKKNGKIPKGKKRGKKQTMTVNPNTLVITTNVNELNIPINRQTQPG